MKDKELEEKHRLLTEANINVIAAAFSALTNHERGLVTEDYCEHCWCKDPSCQCSNDE